MIREILAVLIILYYTIGIYYICSIILEHYLKTGIFDLNLGGRSNVISYGVTLTMWIYILIRSYNK
jgi:hypothetical protein